jgi:hypothetical protein
LWGTISGVERPVIADLPSGLVLEIAGGNPLVSGSRIVFGLPSPAEVKLDVYDVTGRRLAGLIEGHLPQGYHAVRWSGSASDDLRLGPGLYFLRLDSEAGCRTVKAVVAR